MALSYPYGLAVLNDLLPVQSATMDVRRQDEASGTGDGRRSVAILAPPLWTAEIALAPMLPRDARRIAARLRALDGAAKGFFLVDPEAEYPLSDPGGAALGAAVVTLSAIEAGRRVVTFAGLPAGYALSAGDRFALSFSAAPVRHYYGEISEDAVATGAGAAVAVSIFPKLPAGVLAGAAVTFARPACLMAVVSAAPGATGGTEEFRLRSGATFSAAQKVTYR